jgi:aminopeptidase N
MSLRRQVLSEVWGLTQRNTLLGMRCPYKYVIGKVWWSMHTTTSILSLCSSALLLCSLAPPSAQASLTSPIASYTIEVTLDAEAKTLTAHEVVTYVNTTADPIPDLVFHLYLNAFRDRDSLFLQESGLGHGWDPAHRGWIQVTDVCLGDGTPLTLEEIEDGTLARAELPAVVPPGGTVDVELEFQAQLPRVFARTGYTGDFFMVGQWFPKLGVWQDGAWNAYPFHANAEFYADFGTYDVSITLPAGYVTGGTGLPISAVDDRNSTQTVRYHAEGVIDFAWTASPRFQEATRPVDGVEIVYLYLPEHAWTVERALRAAEAAVSHYGRWYGPYPYARLTVVDVPDDGQGAGGMEYPTLVTAGTMNLLGPGGEGGGIERWLESVIVHEIGHQWWQSMVGFNEAEEPWLDEGFTDYSALRVMEAVYGANTSLLDAGNLEMGYLDLHRADYMNSPRVPMYGRAWNFSGNEYRIAAYSKPVLALRTLERTLGEGTMLAVMGTFFRRYQFGHPTTEDFRGVAEEVSGEDLSWFFDGLVYGDGVVNYTVTSVDAHSVAVARQGDLIVPTEVQITFADGSTALEPWDGTATEVTWNYPDQPPVHSAEIDPQHKVVLDLRWADNGRTRQMEVSPWLAVVTRLLYNLQNALLALGGL